MPPHRVRLVGPREERPTDARPVRPQIRRQLVHCHPVDAGTASILPHALEGPCEVRTLDDPGHQIVDLGVLGSGGRRAGFATPLRRWGCTPSQQRELELIARHLAPGLSKASGRVTCHSVRPFTRRSARAATMASADFSLRRTGVVLSDVRRDLPR